MRFIILAAAMLATALSGPVALAQQTQAPATARSAEAVEAAHAVMRLLLIDSGAIPIAVEQAFSSQLPEMRRSIMAAPFFSSLHATRQQALTAYLETLPSVVNEELQAVLPAVVETAAQEMLTLFSDREIVDISSFMRSDAARETIVRSVLGGVNAHFGGPQEPELTAEESAAFAAFEATPSGMAFAAKSAAFNAAMERTISTGFMSVVPALQSRMLRDMCDIMGDQCPAHMQQRA